MSTLYACARVASFAHASPCSPSNSPAAGTVPGAFFFQKARESARWTDAMTMHCYYNVYVRTTLAQLYNRVSITCILRRKLQKYVLRSWTLITSALVGKLDLIALICACSETAWPEGEVKVVASCKISGQWWSEWQAYGWKWIYDATFCTWGL